MKSVLLFLFIYVCLSAGKAQSESPAYSNFINAFNVFFNDKDLKNASISFAAVNLTNGDTVFLHNPQLSLIPASITKVVTTSVALELFGSLHTFSTFIYYTGNIDETGVLNGDIIIKGNGDPSLGSRTVRKDAKFLDEWVKAIKSIGIKEIQGNIISDISYFSDNSVPDNWSWGDMGNYYGAVPMAINVFENEFKLKFHTGSKAGDSTTLAGCEPDVSYMELYNFVETQNVSGDNCIIYGGLYDNNRVALGALPIGRRNFEVRGSVPSPPLLLASMLKSALQSDSIAVEGDCWVYPDLKKSLVIKNDIKLIHEHVSANMKDIVYNTNLRSVNLYAEVLCRHIGLKNRGIASTKEGIRAINEFWKGKINTDGFNLDDGSGLSRANSFNANNMIDILMYMKKSEHFDSFYESLPIAGRTGSLGGMFNGTAAQGVLRAKTGSLNRVRAYAGYTTNAKGHEIAFCLIVNNYSCSAFNFRPKVEKLLVELCK